VAGGTLELGTKVFESGAVVLTYTPAEAEG